MRAPKDHRASRPGMGGDPWRLVSKWNLIEDYPDVSFAAFTSDENKNKTFELPPFGQAGKMPVNVELR